MVTESAVQKELFSPNENYQAEDVVLFALGEFQSRGFELAGRQIALDRLLGAFKRAFSIFEILPLSDEELIAELKTLGAEVVTLPPYVAKHPYRVTIDKDLANQAAGRFEELSEV